MVTLDATSAADPAWTGTVTNIAGTANSGGFIYRVYVRFTKDVESIFGTHNYRVYDNSSTDSSITDITQYFDQGYNFSGHDTAANSVILYNGTDEWVGHELTGFDVDDGTITPAISSLYTVDRNGDEFDVTESANTDPDGSGKPLATKEYVDRTVGTRVSSFRDLADYEVPTAFLPAADSGLEFLGDADASYTYHSASSTGTPFGELEIIYGDITDGTLLFAIQQLNRGVHVAGGTADGTEPTWLGVVYFRQIVPASIGCCTSINIRLTSARPSSFGNLSANALPSTSADLQTGYFENVTPEKQNSVLVFDTVDGVNQWKPYELVGVEIDENTDQIIPTGTNFAVDENVARANTITVRTGNTVLYTDAGDDVFAYMFFDGEHEIPTTTLTSFFTASAGFILLGDTT